MHVLPMLIWVFFRCSGFHQHYNFVNSPVSGHELGIGLELTWCTWQKHYRNTAHTGRLYISFNSWVRIKFSWVEKQHIFGISHSFRCIKTEPKGLCTNSKRDERYRGIAQSSHTQVTGFSGTPVLSNAIQCNGPAIKHVFVKLIVSSFCWHWVREVFILALRPFFRLYFVYY